MLAPHSIQDSCDHLLQLPVGQLKEVLGDRFAALTKHLRPPKENAVKTLFDKIESPSGLKKYTDLTKKLAKIENFKIVTDVRLDHVRPLKKPTLEQQGWFVYACWSLHLDCEKWRAKVSGRAHMEWVRAHFDEQDWSAVRRASQKGQLVQKIWEINKGFVLFMAPFRAIWSQLTINDLSKLTTELETRLCTVKDDCRTLEYLVKYQEAAYVAYSQPGNLADTFAAPANCHSNKRNHTDFLERGSSVNGEESSEDSEGSSTGDSDHNDDGE